MPNGEGEGGGIWGKMGKLLYNPSRNQEPETAIVPPMAPRTLAPPITSLAQASSMGTVRANGTARPDDEKELTDALARATKKGLDEFRDLFTTNLGEIGSESTALNLAIKQATKLLQVTPAQLLEAVRERLVILDSSKAVFSQGLDNEVRGYIAERNQTIDRSVEQIGKLREQIANIEAEIANLSSQADAAKVEVAGVEHKQEQRIADYMVVFTRLRGELEGWEAKLQEKVTA